MPVSPAFLDLVTEALAPLGPIERKRMFGCVGLFTRGRMFAIVAPDDGLYIKADDESRAEFLACGLSPFTYPVRGKPDHSLAYYRLPEAMIDAPADLGLWARRGIEAAGRSARPKRKTAAKGLPDADDPFLGMLIAPRGKDS